MDMSEKTGSDGAVSDGAGESAQSAGEIEAGNARAHRVLLITVIVLGILLVIGFAIVVATIASRIAAGGEQTAGSPDASPAAVTVTAQGDLEVPVPPGYRLIAVAGEERRLVLHLAAEGGPDRLMVVDARSGQVMRSLVLTPEGP